MNSDPELSHVFRTCHLYTSGKGVASWAAHRHLLRGLPPLTSVPPLADEGDQFYRFVSFLRNQKTLSLVPTG